MISWDLLLTLFPYVLGFFGLLGIVFIVFKVIEVRRNKQLKAEYEAKQFQDGSHE